MSEREALLRAICENPDDDTPRLVFADWLQENGDEPRAEFIRAQIDMVTHEQHTIPWHKCRTRANRLLATYQGQWRRELPSNSAWTYQDFQRGFLATLVVRGFDVFTEYAEQIFNATPIRRVNFDGELKLAALGRVPHLDRVSEIWGQVMNCTPDDVQQLIKQFKPTRLTRFVLSNAVLDDEALRLLREHFGDVFGLVIF